MQLVLKKDIEKENKKRIEADFNRITDAANVMQKLLDDLLDLSRVGRQISAFVDVSVKDVVNSSLEMLAGKIAENNVNIMLETNLPTVHVDATRFKEVFLNLIENAIKYKKDNSIDKREIIQNIQWTGNLQNCQRICLGQLMMGHLIIFWE